VYDIVSLPFKCKKCRYEESDRTKLPRGDLWWTKDTRGVLDTYETGTYLVMKGDREIKDGSINVYMECPNCKTLVAAKAYVQDNRLTGEIDFGSPPEGKYW
jgi:hypothetical protein